MNYNIIKEISHNLNIKEYQVKNVVELLNQNNTIPFIARYRKEMTDNLNEEVIRNVNEVYQYQVNLLKRKEEVIKLINEKELLTDDLRFKILEVSKLVEVEDLYQPYKEKKRTKASDAINNGLEPLAKLIMSFPKNGDLDSITKLYINDKVNKSEDAISGAKYIIAEWISENAVFRKWIRSYIFRNGIIETKLKKNVTDENNVYEMYYNYKEDVKTIKAHRVLAINRAEREEIIVVNISVDELIIIDYLKNQIINNNNSWVVPYVGAAIEDSYKRLIGPSIMREIRSELKEGSENVAIDVFGKNIEKLLLQPSLKDKVILGFDPAFRTGCKLAVIDNTGKLLDISVIYPHKPSDEIEKSKKQIIDLVKKYNIDIIAIGNGTASRESEMFIASVIKDIDKEIKYIIVSEAGASVYSASRIAIEEFPNLNVEERSAISIARRLQDPLSELIKIDTKSIGVGEYQHDVAEKKLNETLDFVVSKVVNQVGVNINTASQPLLKYVSGLNKKTIEKIITFRDADGKIKSREDVKKISGITKKIYEQAIGFIRIPDSVNPLDKTGIHPESYDITYKILERLQLNLTDLETDILNEKLNNVDIANFSEELGVDKYTLADIISVLKQPNRDFRDGLPKPLLRSDIVTVEDLKVGMKLQGTVRNVVDFGVFIDIGLKNDCLAHISKLTNKYIKHPLEVVNVGNIVDCYVLDIFVDKGRVSLSLIEPS